MVCCYQGSFALLPYGLVQQVVPVQDQPRDAKVASSPPMLLRVRNMVPVLMLRMMLPGTDAVYAATRHGHVLCGTCSVTLKASAVRPPFKNKKKDPKTPFKTRPFFLSSFFLFLPRYPRSTLAALFPNFSSAGAKERDPESWEALIEAEAAEGYHRYLPVLSAATCVRVLSILATYARYISCAEP
eukprot:3835011-Rhodomonas_salina.3